MGDLPSGTVTFLFTDIEGSTALWERDSEAMVAAVERHHSLIRTAIERHHGLNQPGAMTIQHLTRHPP